MFQRTVSAHAGMEKISNQPPLMTGAIRLHTRGAITVHWEPQPPAP